MSKQSFPGLLRAALIRRQQEDKDISREELDRRHKAINAPGYVNRMFGSMNSADIPRYQGK